jgi:WD40 repeat protein/energy-coupling factor transporter ATP-binding protein EcfA2
MNQFKIEVDPVFPCRTIAISHDVFISYARPDAESASQLNRWLTERGLATFFDQTQLTPGLRWVAAIEEAIETSHAVVILVGPHGLGNTQQYEREMALVKQGKHPSFPVIPILLPGFEGRPSGFLELLTWIDFRGSTDIISQTTALQKLLCALADPAASVVQRDEICPYMGLEPFREEDAIFYHSRSELISELVGQVNSNGFVVVVGRSGSGKSSLIFAGLFPVLREQRPAKVWDILSLHPGAWPLHALAEALSPPPLAAGPVSRDAFIEQEAEALRGGGVERLGRVLERRLESAVENPDYLLIYVDQWEELYAMAPDMDDPVATSQHALDVEKFISLLVGIPTRLRSRCKIVVTIRADFYEQLLGHPLGSNLLPQQQVNIGPLKESDLRAAIVEPASTAGLRFEPPELVQRILEDVGTDEGMLPLLQYALKETWARREGKNLTADGYTAAGGVRGAIQSTAERTYASLSPDEKKAARRLFLGLVKPGEGRDDTRARLPISDDPEIKEIIRKFSDRRARLLITGSEIIGRAVEPKSGRAVHKQRATVEVAHEALIRNWSTLREWLDLNRDRLRARSAILQGKADWEASGQDDRALLATGFQLDRARALVNDPGDVPLDDIREYIDRSIAGEDRRIAKDLADQLETQRQLAEADRRAREAAEVAAQEAKSRAEAEQKARFEADRAATNLRIWLGVAIFAAVAAAVALTFAGLQRIKAIENLQAAFLTNAEQALTEQRPTLAHMLAQSGLTKQSELAILEWTPSVFWSWDKPRDQVVRLQSIAALTRPAATSPLKSWMGVKIATAVTISPDGHRAGIGDALGRIYVEPISNDEKGYVLSGHSKARVLSLSFAGSSHKVVSATASEIIIWNLQTSQSRVICTHGLTEAAVDSVGKYLTWAQKDGQIALLDISVDSSQPIFMKDERPALAVSISADGNVIASAQDDGAVVVRTVSSRNLIAQIPTARSDIISIAIDSAGTRVAVASLSGSVEVWKVTSLPQRPLVISTPEDKRWKVRFSENGKWMAVASWRGAVALWDARDLTYAGTIDGHDHRVNGLDFSEDSNLLVTASESGIARLWELKDIQPTFREAKATEAGEHIVGGYDRTGSLFASGAKDGIARIYSVHPDGQPEFLCATAARTDRLIGLSFLTNALVTIQLAERNLGAYDVIEFSRLSDCQPELQLHDPDRTAVEGVAYDARNSILAWGDSHGRISLMSTTQSGDRVWMPRQSKQVHTASIADLAFSPNGKYLASAGNDGIAAIWNIEKKELDHVKHGPTARLNTIQFSQDGKYVAAGGDDKSIYIWDVGSAEPAQVLPFAGGTNRLAFSPDSSMLAAGSDSRQLVIWSTQNWEKVFQLNKMVGVRSVYGFHPTRGDLAFDGENGVIRIIPGASFQRSRDSNHRMHVTDRTEIEFDLENAHAPVGRSSALIAAADRACF